MSSVLESIASLDAQPRRQASDAPSVARRLARHFADADAVRLLDGAALQPRAGDLVLARIDELGKHADLEQAGGRRSALFCDDEVIVTYAARYAPDQFEAQVPATLAPCQLVAGGGVAAEVVARHVTIAPATEIMPIAPT